MTSKVRDTQSGLSDEGLDVSECRCLIGSLKDPVEVNRAAGPDGRKGVREEFEGGMGQVEDDSIDGGNLL